MAIVQFYQNYKRGEGRFCFKNCALKGLIHQKRRGSLPWVIIQSIKLIFAISFTDPSLFLFCSQFRIPSSWAILKMLAYWSKVEFDWFSCSIIYWILHPPITTRFLFLCWKSGIGVRTEGNMVCWSEIWKSESKFLQQQYLLCSLILLNVVGLTFHFSRKNGVN